MDWDQDISAQARETMDLLGSFGPTANGENREVKGTVNGDKFYADSKRLREMANHFIEVANWLDRRAWEYTGGVKR